MFLAFNSLKLFILVVLIIDNVLGVNQDTFWNEFCDCHEHELQKIHKKCSDDVLHVEVRNAFYVCLIELRNTRAPYKAIDGKYRQFVLCDKEMFEELGNCEKEKLQNLKVDYDIKKNFEDMIECVYTELLIAKRMEERRMAKEGSADPPKPPAKKKKKAG